MLLWHNSIAIKTSRKGSIMKKPVIGISTSVIVDHGGEFPDYERIYVNKDYISAVIAAGAVPLMIPMEDSEDNLQASLELVDAVIFSGGHDITPFRYGEEPHAKLHDICPERDAFDFLLYRLAKEKKLPILGICRGYQLMNVAEGGSLYQDLSLKSTESFKHSQGHGPSIATHTMKVEAGSKLAQILGKEEIRINSFHHQAIKDVAKSLKVSGKALDDVVEAVELTDYPFGIGVQFHPEMLQAKDETIKKIFLTLVEAGKEYQKTK